ncbi:hypothetical protein Z043_126155 [Scleropages formosus]|uniref:Uncharacterized protein n=1 Tax=Scleropages formosus TaxID=113540 RepID=A0A0P7U980_SCLFO|nr:hypothetical protein Z043_126155 [Scleropages formosus]
MTLRLKVLDLCGNSLCDTGVKVLSAGLRHSNCKLDTLKLASCKLTMKCCEALATVLCSDSSNLRVLELSDNDLHDSGMKLLSTGLWNPHCKLETLSMDRCSLTMRSSQVLASVFSRDPSQLRKLDLSNNDLEDSGVKLLCFGLGNQHCKLETLRVTEGGCVALDSALCLNPSHLRDLDLSYNNPGDLGLKLLTARLEDPKCKLEKLK